MSKKSGGSRHYQCQWPTDCPFTATAHMKRGERVEFMQLCTNHANQFMCMTNAECADVYKRRQPQRWVHVNSTPGIFSGPRA